MKYLSYSILSGLLLAFSWTETGFFPLLFFGFIPLLLLERGISDTVKSKSGRIVFIYSFISFLIFNIITTYWIVHATLFGAICAFVINSSLMSLVFILFHKIKIYTNNRMGYLSFIFLWISMEYLHLNWDLSWPWLTLGNGFANIPEIIQWYEFTGVFGGSLWILLTNILLFRLFNKLALNKILYSFFLLIIPIIFSYILIPEDNNQNQIKSLIIQPNIDPYHDKFTVNYKEQLDNFIALARTQLNQEVDLLIGPETGLQEMIWENTIELSYSLIKIRELQKDFPNLNIIIGANTYKMFLDIGKKTATARKMQNKDVFYDVYNSAIFIPDTGESIVYHKTKLVPGAEKIPFPRIFNHISALSVDLGGVSGSLGSENTVTTFNFSEIKLLPLICYESIYGDIITNKDSDILCVITNDGWWKNTSGYKQHFAYARLRAIEQRKTVVRSANTGISGVINQKGEVLNRTKWDEINAMLVDININQKKTFYNQYGDFIGRISVFITLVLLPIVYVQTKIKSYLN